MNISVEQISDTTSKIVAQVSEADYADKVTAELRKIGKTHQIPGFRKGHVDIIQLRRRFGKQVKADVLNDVVFNDVVKYIIDNHINILGQPLPMEMHEINLDDKDYTFEYEVGMAPAFEVKLDKSVKLPYYVIDVTDEMVAEQDKSLRERFGSQVPGDTVDEKAVVKGVLMQLDAEGKVNENEGAIQVNNGIIAPFLFKGKAEAEKFIGHKVGDKIVFNPYAAADGNAAELSSMLNVDKEIAGDVKSDFEFVISEIIVVKPADDGKEYYDAVFGADKVTTPEEYTAGIRAMIAQSLRGNSDMLFNRTAEKYLMDTYAKDMELPTEFLKRWLVRSNDEFTAENVDEKYAQVESSIKWELVSGRTAEALGVKIEEADLMARASWIARQQFQQYGIYNMDDDTVADTAKRILADKNYRQHIANEVEDLKMFATLREAITIEGTTVDMDKFKELAAAEA